MVSTAESEKYLAKEKSIQEKIEDISLFENLTNIQKEIDDFRKEVVLEQDLLLRLEVLNGKFANVKFNCGIYWRHGEFCAPCEPLGLYWDIQCDIKKEYHEISIELTNLRLLHNWKLEEAKRKLLNPEKEKTREKKKKK